MAKTDKASDKAKDSKKAKKRDEPKAKKKDKRKTDKPSKKLKPRAVEQAAAPAPEPQASVEAVSSGVASVEAAPDAVTDAVTEARPKLPSSGHKGISRVDHAKRNTHGWYVRVRYNGETRSKFFSDSVHGGPQKALQLAVRERNRMEKEMDKPRTDRVIIATNPVNRSGIIGVKKTLKQGAPVYEVTWSPRAGVVSRTSVSIRKWGEKEALRRASLIRREKERLLYGGTIKSLVLPAEE